MAVAPFLQGGTTLGGVGYCSPRITETAGEPESIESDNQLSPALFLNRYGAPLSRFGVRKLILRLCSEAGLEKRVSPHIFRHTFASMKAESGRVSPYQLQHWLGHKDLKTTQIYVHMSEEYARRAMEATSL
jgi:site-specific recombinase XerD